MDASPLRSTLQIWRLFWLDSPRRVRAEAALRLAAVVVVQLVRGRASTWLSTARRKQLDTMVKDGGADRSAIFAGLLRYMAALLALSPIGKVYLRLQRGLRFQWGNYLTMHFVSNFVEAQCLSYGYVGEPALVEAGANNPDQRIASDVETFAQLSSGLCLDVLQAAINLHFQSSLLWRLSPPLSKIVLVTATCGALCTAWLGRALKSMYAVERRAAGDFLYSLTRLRENAESIAFYGGQHQEVEKLSEKLRLRQSTEWTRFARKDVVQQFSNMYRNVLGLLPAYWLAGRGTGTDVGLVTQVAEAFQEVLSSLLVFTENTSDFSRLAALGAELHSFHRRAVSSSSERSSQKQCANIKLVPTVNSASWLRIDRLSLWTQGETSRLLVKELSVDMPAQGGVLVSGPSGVGKTTLLRAIAGLWQNGQGTIERETDPSRVLFLPQRPYMQLGSLRDQLHYPAQSGDSKLDAELRDILERVGLGHVLRRCGDDLGAVRRWTEELSIGEQQRISVARLLFHKPAFALLDEITSANDKVHEQILYKCVLDTCQAFVSIGHRESIEAYHRKRVILFGDSEGGRWEIRAL